MNLQGIQGTYDAVISLGATCQVAYQLRRHNLRNFSVPIDWMRTPSLFTLNAMIRSGFAGFMEWTNLSVIDHEHGSPTFTVLDMATQIQSVHDFSIAMNTIYQLASYPEFRDTLNRRIHRFYEYLAGAQSILFVRGGATFEEAADLQAALTGIIPGDFRILIVNWSGVQHVTEHEGGLAKVSFVEIPFRSEWYGNNSWSYLLGGVRLRYPIAPQPVDAEVSHVVP